MQENVLTVSQVNAYISNLFQRNDVLSAVYMKGEISNCKYHSSGHIYFTLKDAGAQIACVMFAGNAKATEGVTLSGIPLGRRTVD